MPSSATTLCVASRPSTARLWYRISGISFDGFWRHSQFMSNPNREECFLLKRTSTPLGRLCLSTYAGNTAAPGLCLCGTIRYPASSSESVPENPPIGPESLLEMPCNRILFATVTLLTESGLAATSTTSPFAVLIRITARHMSLGILARVATIMKSSCSLSLIACVILTRSVSWSPVPSVVRVSFFGLGQNGKCAFLHT